MKPRSHGKLRDIGVSAHCREGEAGHSFCSGRRYVGRDPNGPIWGKCQCRCHRSAAKKTEVGPLERGPEGEFYLEVRRV